MRPPLPLLPPDGDADFSPDKVDPNEPSLSTPVDKFFFSVLDEMIVIQNLGNGETPCVEYLDGRTELSSLKRSAFAP